jgi:hypothetical protein
VEHQYDVNSWIDKEGRFLCTADCPACFAEKSAKTPWMQTFSGLKVNPLDLKADDIWIEDIAHHLATMNRWCGALSEPISIAQHSVHVSLLCDGTGAELHGLLHDGSEAYLGDVVRWLKNSDAMAAYREAEDRAQRAIYRRFGLSEVQPLVVDEADRAMIGVEGSFGIMGWHAFPGFEMPTEETMRKSRFYGALPWWEAKLEFMKRFERLTR